MRWKADFLQCGGKLPDRNLDPPQRGEDELKAQCKHCKQDGLCVLYDEGCDGYNEICDDFEEKEG